MKKLFLLIFIFSLAIPVCAETLVFTNGKKLTCCSFETISSLNDRAVCKDGIWHDYDCKDKGICISQIIPDSKLAKWNNGFENFLGMLTLGFAGTPSNTFRPTFFNVYSNGAGGYYGMSY